MVVAKQCWRRFFSLLLLWLQHSLASATSSLDPWPEEIELCPNQGETIHAVGSFDTLLPVEEETGSRRRRLNSSEATGNETWPFGPNYKTLADLQPMASFSLAFSQFPDAEKRPSTGQEVNALLCQVNAFFPQRLRDRLQSSTLHSKAVYIDWQFNEAGSSDVVVRFTAFVYYGDETHTQVDAQQVREAMWDMTAEEVQEFLRNYVWLSEPVAENAFYNAEAVTLTYRVNATLVQDAILLEAQDCGLVTEETNSTMPAEVPATPSIHIRVNSDVPVLVNRLTAGSNFFTEPSIPIGKALVILKSQHCEGVDINPEMELVGPTRNIFASGAISGGNIILNVATDAAASRPSLLESSSLYTEHECGVQMGEPCVPTAVAMNSEGPASRNRPLPASVEPCRKAATQRSRTHL